MRILQLHTPYRQTGGEDAVVEAEREALRDAGHEVHQHLRPNPTDAIRAGLSLLGSAWNPLAAQRVLRLVDAIRPDVGHVHNTWFASSPSVVATLRRRRIPVVMTVHNFRMVCANALFLRDDVPCESCLLRGPLPAVRHRCYRGSLTSSTIAAAGIGLHRKLGTWAHLVDRFIVLSEFARSRLLAAGLPEERLTLGSNFVRDPGPRSAPPSHSPHVLFVGRLSREKGLHVLLEAWRAARPTGLRLDVLGDGPEREGLTRDPPPNVTFLGSRPRGEVLARLLRARALVIPSVWYEGQPIVALEGLAAGVPLVLSEIGGLPEVLGGREAGWTTSPGDATRLADALNGLADETIVDARGMQSRQRYEESFTPARAVVRLENLYRGLSGAAAP